VGVVVLVAAAAGLAVLYGTSGLSFIPLCLDPGFTTVSTKPAYPIPTNTPAGASSGQVGFHFVVNVKAPPSQYNGPLLLVATTQ
jgi:hypothetical protein